ncbi:MAG TPA: HupE/UreJ family protein [Stellaceae bacterium]|nr:HupE/UreJ family protein [Stellaceae bacterium]
MFSGFGAVRHVSRCRRPVARIVSASFWRAIAGAAALALMPGSSALAHIIQGEAGGFRQGFEHPLTGADHFLAMFAVGIWGAQMGGRSVWALPVTFPLIMAAGGLAGMLGLPLPHVELGIALSILALGSAIAFGWHPSEAIALVLIGVFAICHGYAHGVELPTAADPADYAVGFVMATGMIHVLGVGVGLLLNKPFEGRVSRALGAVIAAGGVYFLVV